ncbi:hypothetical protein [Burkholderia sp. BDU5]|uniref:hypothetical protein n=1 Tax=Burkholderia sp. BDU5 TaxID=1385590 RepID=UPI00075F49D8|nr:hypothetical protein [Burkholderia sp. BDU5]KVE35710.1 hypothetical protein WS69_13750 [Burkholderia sp. BDU5]
MRTATIEVYHVWGTKSHKSADVLYRGKLLCRRAGIESQQKLLDEARKWAHDHGFTHVVVRHIS